MSKQSYSAQEGLGYLGEDLLIQGTVHTEKKIVVSPSINASNKEVVVLYLKAREIKKNVATESDEKNGP